MSEIPSAHQKGSYFLLCVNKTFPFFVRLNVHAQNVQNERPKLRMKENTQKKVKNKRKYRRKLRIEAQLLLEVSSTVKV